MKLLIIKNPKSGNRANDNLFGVIEQKKQQYAWDVRLLTMEDAGVCEKIADEISSFQPDVLVAVGGDGTVNLVAEMGMQHKLPFAIIPAGSANGMSRELLIPNNYEQAFDVLANGKTLPIDLLSINEKICIHLADVGVNARIVKRFQQDKKRGVFTYAKYLFNELFLTKKYRFYIEYDGENCVHKGVSLTFANSSKYGTGAVINPLGKIDDGKFELCIMKPFPKTQLPVLTWKMFRGTLHTSDYFQIISCTEAKVHTNRKTTLQIDGEVLGKVRDITIRMLHKAVSVYVP